MDRRHFCVSSAAAVIAGAAADWACGLGQTAAPAGLPSVRVHQFVYDRRYPAARAFGVAALQTPSMSGAVAIEGDITALWLRDLRPLWIAGAAAIAGMTTARSLFCLEQLAGEHWRRVVIRAEHGIPQGRGVTHRLTASEPMAARMRSALSSEDWPGNMPAALAACASRDAVRPASREFASELGGRWTRADEKLVSFVIA
jgi:hypothetical protein